MKRYKDKLGTITLIYIAVIYFGGQLLGDVEIVDIPSPYDAILGALCLMPVLYLTILELVFMLRGEGKED